MIEHFVKCLYYFVAEDDDTMQKTIDEILEILDIAVKYQVEDIITTMENRTMSLISVENVVRIVRSADVLARERLMECAQIYANGNRNKFFQQYTDEEIFSLPRSFLIPLMRKIIS